MLNNKLTWEPWNWEINETGSLKGGKWNTTTKQKCYKIECAKRWKSFDKHLYNVQQPKKGWNIEGVKAAAWVIHFDTFVEKVFLVNTLLSHHPFGVNII